VTRRSSPVAPPRTREILITPAAVLDRVMARWRASLASRYSPDDIDGFIRRNRPALEAAAAQAIARRRGLTRARTPHWFELYNPRGGVPRESLPGYRRARELAAAIFDRALALLDEPVGEIDLASALSVLGATDDEGEYDSDEATALAEELPFLVGTIDWSPEEVGDLLVAVMDTEARGGIMADEDVRARIADRIWEAERHLELRSIDKDQACDFVARHHSLLPYCNPRGMMYAIGAFWRQTGDDSARGRELVAVATAGTPTGRWGPGTCPVDGILELTRIASVSGLTRQDRRGRTVPVNASSALASRLMDLLPTSGRRGAVGCRFVTYSVVGERATTYLALVAKGLRPVGIIRGKPSSEVAMLDKIVWEAGSAARAPDWNVLPPDRREGAIRAFAGRR
jgi:hypothetical protein